MRWNGAIARTALWCGLQEVRVYGLEETAAALRRGPLILAANHSCFWDAMLVVEVSRRLGARCHVLVDAERLRQLPFFAAWGAIGIDRGGPAIRRGLRRAADALQAPGDVLWIFPQGRYRPPSVRPLGLRPGVSWIANRTGASVVPVALTYPFLEGIRPAAWVGLRAPLLPDQVEHLEAALCAGIDAMDEIADEACAAALPAPPGPASRALSAVYRLVGGRVG